MFRQARFYKVSFKEFVNSIKELHTEFETATMQQLIYNYNSISLPYRMNENSISYNIETPFPLYIQPMESIIVPTGIVCDIKKKYIFNIIKSNLLIEVESIYLIEPDYKDQILLRLTNLTDDTLKYNRNDIICKGIFTKCELAINDRIGRDYNNYDE